MSRQRWAVHFTERGRREFDLVPPAYRRTVQQAIDELPTAEHSAKPDGDELQRPGFTVYYQLDPSEQLIWVTGVDHFWRMDKPRWGLIGPGLISG